MSSEKPWASMTIHLPAYTEGHSGLLDNYQKSMARQCYRCALPVRDKLSRYASSSSPTCPRCGQDSETVLCTIIQCQKISEFGIYVEHLLSHQRRVQLSNESIIKIVPSSSLNKEEQACFLLVVAIMKVVEWKMRV